MAPSVSPEQRVDRLGTVQVLPEDRTTSLGQTGLQQTRTTERERRGSVAALASFWTEVILACPAVLDPGHGGRRNRQGGGRASCPSDPRSLCRTLPDLALALLCQPL